MAAPRAGDVNNQSFNPYHYSYSLCAGSASSVGNENTNKRGNSSRNYGPSGKHQRRIPGYEHYLVSETANEFHCDRCDRSFKSEPQYDSHIDEHITCGRDGCQFTAHPKVVENHVKMQHLTGLYQKIGNLSNSEEIAKWVAERKKNYPSLKSKAQKQALDAAKRERGERVKPQTGQFSSSLYKRERKQPNENGNQRPNRQQRPQRSRGRKGRERRPFLKKSIDPANTADGIEVEWNGSVPSFRGIGSLEAGEERKEVVVEETAQEHLHITDDEEEVLSKSTEPLPSCSKQSDPFIPVNRSLGLLMASYGSGESDDDGPPQEMKTVRSETPPVAQSKSELFNPLERNMEEKPTERRPQKRHFDSSRNPRRNDRNINGRTFTRPTRKPTLLERLLNSEIIHERNVILQCVRYVVQNDFFGAGKKAKVEGSEE